MSGAFAIAGTAAAETWRGLNVAPENRCSCYHKDPDYRHPASVEPKIVEQQGGIFGPYTAPSSRTMACSTDWGYR